MSNPGRYILVGEKYKGATNKLNMFATFYSTFVTSTCSTYASTVARPKD